MKIVTAIVSLAFVLLVTGCDTPPDNEPSNNQLLVYPNPAINSAFVDVYPDGKSFDLRVFDTKGEMILQEADVEEKHYSLLLGDKPDGDFHVVLKVGGSTVTKKLVKL